VSRARNLNSGGLPEAALIITPPVTVHLQFARLLPLGRFIITRPVDRFSNSSSKGHIALLVILTSDRTGKIALLISFQGARIKSKALLKSLVALGFSQCDNLLIPFPWLYSARATVSTGTASTRARTERDQACWEAPIPDETREKIQRGIVERLKSLVNGAGKTVSPFRIRNLISGPQIHILAL